MSSSRFDVCDGCDVCGNVKEKNKVESQSSLLPGKMPQLLKSTLLPKSWKVGETAETAQVEASTAAMKQLLQQQQQPPPGMHQSASK